MTVPVDCILTWFLALDRVISLLHNKSCDVGVTWLINATGVYECYDINSLSCQLYVELALHTFNYGSITCKLNASFKCKSAISKWAKAYENATNAEECKNADPKYKVSQNAAKSCK